MLSGVKGSKQPFIAGMASGGAFIRGDALSSEAATTVVTFTACSAETGRA